MVSLQSVSAAIPMFSSPAVDGGILRIPRYAKIIEGFNAVSNAINLIWTIFKHYIMNSKGIKPSAVVGGIPLPGVQELSGALSDLILKYRATGGVFLAHQDGGNESFRVVGKSWGPNRFVFLTMLQFLFVYGSSFSVDFFSNMIDPKALYGVLAEADLTPNPWREFDRNASDQGLQEGHLTFPIVTKNRIYTNMYIETYHYEESVDVGRDCVKYTIFFQKFRGFTPYKYFFTLHPVTGERLFYYKDDEEKNKERGVMSTLSSLALSSLFMFLLNPDVSPAYWMASNFVRDFQGRTSISNVPGAHSFL